MTTFYKIKAQESDDKTNIDTNRVAANYTGYHIISNLIFQRIIIPKFLISNLIFQRIIITKFFIQCKKM